jgi:hypothetical protein
LLPFAWRRAIRRLIVVHPDDARRTVGLNLEAALVAEVEEADEAVGGRDVGELVGRVRSGR